MIDRCPGRDNRNLTSEIRPCLNCGYGAEMFSDEVRIKCPKCGGEISRVRLPACVDWCKAARECVGEERWKQLKGGA